jgi:hypothetical protein
MLRRPLDRVWTLAQPVRQVPPTTPDCQGDHRSLDTSGRRRRSVAWPAELAPIFVYPATGEASYITEEVVGVTGGNPLP